MSKIRYIFLEIGAKFGNWEVLDYVGSLPNKKGRKIYYKCRCICGNERNVSHQALRDGTSVSCRCSRRLPLGEAARNLFFYRYKYYTNKRKIFWGLSKEEFDILVVKDCTYCGSPPRPMLGVKYHGKFYCNLNGIDRKDSQQGYILENCATCCSYCNIMKSDKSIDDFLNQIEKIYKYNKKEF